jgi:iron complex outermembrane receptor protein
MKVSLGVFLRDAQQTIDWVKTNPSDKWQPQNLTRLQTFGLTFNFSKKFDHDWLKKLQLSYAYLEMKKSENQSFISKYVLDYLKHKLTVDFSHKFIYDTEIHWTALYKDRNGQYLDYVDNAYQLFDYQPYFLTHIKCSKQINRTRLAISVENLFDVEYNDLSYIKMPGRWFIFELNYKVK